MSLSCHAPETQRNLYPIYETRRSNRSSPGIGGPADPSAAAEAYSNPRLKKNTRSLSNGSSSPRYTHARAWERKPRRQPSTSRSSRVRMNTARIAFEAGLVMDKSMSLPRTREITSGLHRRTAWIPHERYQTMPKRKIKVADSGYTQRISRQNRVPLSDDLGGNYTERASTKMVPSPASSLPSRKNIATS